VRELRYNVAQPGCRSQTITVATGLVDDAEVYSKEDIAQPSGTGGGECAQKLLWLSSRTCVSWMVVFDEEDIPGVRTIFQCVVHK